jgi:hypothetical protein
VYRIDQDNRREQALLHQLAVLRSAWTSAATASEEAAAPPKIDGRTAGTRIVERQPASPCSEVWTPSSSAACGRARGKSGLDSITETIASIYL